MSGNVKYLDVVFYKSEGKFVAHCLHLDLVQEASNFEQAKCDMEDVIIAHINYTIENDNWDNFYKPAPDIYWSLLPKAEEIEEDESDTDVQDCPYSVRNWRSSQELNL